MASAVVTIQRCTVTGYLLLSQPALWVCMHVHTQGGLCMCLLVYLLVLVLMYAIFNVHKYTSALCCVCGLCHVHTNIMVFVSSSTTLVFCEMSF